MFNAPALWLCAGLFSVWYEPLRESVVQHIVIDLGYTIDDADSSIIITVHIIALFE